MIDEKFRVVLDVAFRIDGRREGYDNKAPPDAGVHCSHFRQVVCIEYQRMRRREIRRIFILLFRLDLVRGTKLLDHGGGKAHAFLKLRRNEEPFPFGFSKLGLHVASDVSRERIS